MRFFTFQPIITDILALKLGGDQGPGGVPQLRSDTPYFLEKQSSHRPM